MNHEETEILLAEYGFEIWCWSPFEIGDENGNRAFGQCAEMVVDYLKTRMASPIEPQIDQDEPSG